MGDDASNGVVDWRGTVFNPAGSVHAGLHVLDGAMLPTAVGVNPFLTIASLSMVAARSIRASLGEPVATSQSAPATAHQQARYPAPRKRGGEPVTLRFKEHLTGNWRGPEPEWLAKLSPELTPQERERAWIVAVEVSLDVDQWVANPSMQLDATLRLYRNPRPNDITVHPDACQGTPVLEGTGRVSLLALDAPQGSWDQITRIASALQAFLERRGWGELTSMASSGTPHPGESRLGAAFRRILGFWRAARNLSFHRELRYDFELHRPERPQFRLQAQGTKRLAYVPGAKNLWDALIEIDLNLTPHNGQNPATLSLTVDLIDMVRNRRLQVVRATNTPAGMAGMIAFSALWMRVIFQTHFWTFRGLDYAQLKPPRPAQHGLLRGALAPVRVALPVPRYADAARGQDTLELELTRYTPASNAPGPEHHLLMVHGLAHGGTVFTTATSDGNNMAAAFVDAGYTVWVLDHRLSNRLPYCNNDHCMDDVAQLDIPAAVRHVYAVAGAPVAVFAHCVGGGAFAMATLKGWLMDPVSQRSMVGSAIIHAVHPWVVPSPSNQLSGSLSILYKDLLPERMSIDPVPPALQGGALDQVLDRLGASLPWPASDSDLHRRDQFDPLGGTATCNRMTLFYGREWVHANLNPATHRELASLVGPASLEVFRQLFFIVNRQRLTDRDGASVYMTAPQFQAHWTFPILFAHGSANAVFDPRSAVRSWGRLQQLQPDRVVRLFKAEGYGHMDFLFGQNAHRDVYPHLCKFLHDPAAFESSWGANHDPNNVPHHWQDAEDAATRRPLVGPAIRLGETTVDHNLRRQLILWTEFPNDPTRAATAPSLCDAEGAPLDDWSATRLQHVHLNPALDRKTTLLHGPGAYWTGRLTESSPGAFQNLDTLHLRWGEQGTLGEAHLSLAHLPWFKRWTGVPVPEPVSWLALSCRWPGTPFESEAVDAVAVQMQYHVTRSSLPVDALVMLGDQIYADATANMMKTRETDEVLAGMYRDAWGGPHTRALLASVPSYTVVDDHEYGDNWCGCDDVTQDAAFINGFEAALAYQWRWPDGPVPKYQSTPSVDGPEVMGFWNAFQVGGVPFFAADTRSERQLRSPSNWRTRTLFGTAQMNALKAWLLEHKDVPKVLCSGSVMGFVERELDETPGKCLAADSWNGYPATWRELVRFVVAEQIQHLVFLSGDYHFSGISELALHAEGAGAPVRALSVACSGWNATLPFANAVPQNFVMDRAVDYPQSDSAVRIGCTARAMSTAHRQFSKLTLTQDAHGAWCLTVRVYDEHGERKDLASENF
jgi:cholesterol oxidase